MFCQALTFSSSCINQLLRYKDKKPFLIPVEIGDPLFGPFPPLIAIYIIWLKNQNAMAWIPDMICYIIAQLPRQRYASTVKYYGKDIQFRI